MRTTDHRDHVRGNDRDPTNIGVVHAEARARALNADGKWGALFALRWLLLRHAVHGAQPPYEVAGINGDHQPGREEFGQSVQRDAVIRIIEYGHEYHAVGDIEICVAGREPSPRKHNRPGHRELDNVEGLAVLIMRGLQSAE